jgi:hypothetical protein
MASLSEGEALIQFFTLKQAADIVMVVGNGFNGPTRFTMTTMTDYLRGPFAREAGRLSSEIWFTQSHEDGNERPLAMRDVSNAEIWFFDKKFYLASHEKYFDERQYFHCYNIEAVASGEKAKGHLVPRLFDCRTCEKQLACVTKGWTINIP